MILTDINFLAVVLATIANIVLGMFWYSPSILGTIWAKAHNFSMPILNPAPVSYFLSIGVSFITALFLAFFINWLNITTVWEGIKLAIYLWIGFIATTHFSGVIWARKSYLAYLIDSAFQLVSLVIMAIIITFWN